MFNFIGIVDAIIYATLLVVIFILLFDSIKLRLKHKGLMNEIVQLNLNSMAYADKLISLQDELNVVESDGFLKFVSESREAAFEYIEDVQVAIKELSVAMSADDQEAIGAAYYKLVNFLPDEKTNND